MARFPLCDDDIALPPEPVVIQWASLSGDDLEGDGELDVLAAKETADVGPVLSAAPPPRPSSASGRLRRAPPPTTAAPGESERRGGGWGKGGGFGSGGFSARGESGREGATAPRKRVGPRKPNAPRILRWAEHHCNEHAATQAGLAAMLLRRCQRAQRLHEGVALDECEAWIATAVAKMVSLGLVNDEAFSDARSARLSRSGKGERDIRQCLRQKGVPVALAEESLRRIEEAVEHPGFGADSDLVADAETCRCAAAVRKRRLGPCRTTPAGEDPRKEEQKAFAALGRQGFSYATCKKVLAMTREEVEDLALRLP